MPRKKQDRPKHVTKWEDGGETAGGSCEGKEEGASGEEEANNATDNDPLAPPLQQSDADSAADDTDHNSAHTEPNIKPVDDAVNAVKTVKSVNSNNAANSDTKRAQKIKCDIAVTRDNLTSSDSVLPLRINAKHSKHSKHSKDFTKDDSHLILSQQLSESDITSTQLPSSSPKQQPQQMETDDASAPLDFSIKPNKKKSKQNGPQITKDVNSERNATTNATNDAPLDLSIGKRLFSQSSSSPSSSSSVKCAPSAKLPRFDSTSPWNYSTPRALTPPKQSQSHSDISTLLWNGKLKNNILSNKLCSPSQAATSPSSSSSPARVSNASHSGRQNPWQTQWINRSSEQTRDVFTCVWCKESFRSLAEMTDHMKKSPRCGMAGMQHAATASTHNNIPAQTGSTTATPTASHQQPSTSSHSPKEPISSSVLAKNNVGLPRKLVRGQDVWLGRGAEQTRQILKCMWCGQSFKTLADMTTHMRVTQHYTNIISQEQIISWRTPEDKLTQAQVNAVLTCKVCDEAFGSLKELSYHMVKNAHYKEHILRSITEGGHGRRRQTRERRKKSLPVRKLLELERREMTKSDKEDRDSPNNASPNGQSITCDECHEKVDAKSFISHIKLCKTQIKSAMRSIHLDKSPDRVKTPSSSGSHSGPPSRGQTVSPQVKTEIKTEAIDNESRSDTKDDANSDSNAANSSGNIYESPAPSFGSVLNAIEKLIEKSFDSKSRKAQSTGILQRLGIDEEVCPPWQHMPQVPWCRNGTATNEFFSDGRASSRSSGRHSSSPLPQDLMKESNGSFSSAGSDDDCDDSNSSSSLINNIRMPLNSRTETKKESQSLKLSFPISSLISDKTGNESESVQKFKISSPKTESNSNPATPQPIRDRYAINDAKSDNLSDISDDEKEVTSSPNRELSSPIDDQIKRENKLKTSGDNCAQSPQLRRCSPAQRTQTKSDDRSDKNGSSESDTFHPLMQLQKLLDKTDSGSKNKAISVSNTVSNNSGVGGVSSLVAFSWACNNPTNSVSNANERPNDEKNQKNDQHLMKCAFCETHFISKGAYRHHLSKMHFIKADKHSELPNTSNTSSNSNNNNRNANSDHSGPKEATGSGTANATNASDIGITANESPHSKFLKYTELAKQLSSKYV